MKVTTKQIAKEAGVSMTTVTNVLNNRNGRVSEKTREKVLSIIEKYNYTPDMNARSLSSSTSNLIGLLYCSYDEGINFSDPFVSEILEGIEQITKANGYFVLVHNVYNLNDIRQVQKNWKFDGFIVVGASFSDLEAMHDIFDINTPVVFLDTHYYSEFAESIYSLENRYFIATDDIDAGRLAGDYLIRQGHEKIAFYSYEFDKNTANVINFRLIGLRSILNANSVELPESAIFSIKEIEDFVDCISNYTAIVASSDKLAIQLLHYLKQEDTFKGLNISIIGFDDITYSKFVDPPLTTIRLNNVDKGKEAATLLLNTFDGKEISKSTLLKGKLIVRESVQSLLR